MIEKSDTYSRSANQNEAVPPSPLRELREGRGAEQSVEALVEEVNREFEARSGRRRLWGWFGLSRASWLTLPRVLMHEMPDDWQKRMAVLLEEMDEQFPSWGEQDLYVSAKRGGRFERVAEWLCNYGYPNSAEIERAKGVRS